MQSGKCMETSDLTPSGESYGINGVSTYHVYLTLCIESLSCCFSIYSKNKFDGFTKQIVK